MFLKETLKAIVPNHSSLEPIITICGEKFGDFLAQMLEFCKVEVLHQNHVGDWGT